MVEIDYARKIITEDGNVKPRPVVFCWGRFNPPTVGHKLVFDKAFKLAEQKNAAFYIFASQTHDKDKNPLTYEEKLKILIKYFPNYARNVVRNSKVRTLFNAAKALNEKGFKQGYLVVGEDRLTDFQTQLNQYKDLHNFDHIKVISAGDRNENSNDITGVSGQKLRSFVRNGDINSFREHSPSEKRNVVDDVYHSIRRTYGISMDEIKTPNVELERSEERELYYAGKLVQENDTVLVKSLDKIGIIQSLGTNYVTVKFINEEKIKRCWITDISKL